MAIAVKRKNNNLSWSTKNWKVPVKKKVSPRFKFQVDWVDLSMIKLASLATASRFHAGRNCATTLIFLASDDGQRPLGGEENSCRTSDTRMEASSLHKEKKRGEKGKTEFDISLPARHLVSQCRVSSQGFNQSLRFILLLLVSWRVGRRWPSQYGG